MASLPRRVWESVSLAAGRGARGAFLGEEEVVDMPVVVYASILLEPGEGGFVERQEPRKTVLLPRQNRPFMQRTRAIIGLVWCGVGWCEGVLEGLV